MKRIFACILTLALALSAAGCGSSAPEETPNAQPADPSATQIRLADGGITVDGTAISTDSSAPV